MQFVRYKKGKPLTNAEKLTGNEILEIGFMIRNQSYSINFYFYIYTGFIRNDFKNDWDTKNVLLVVVSY